MDSYSWQYNDGGREAAGYRGEAGDCVVRAIAIATGMDYQEVYDELARRVEASPKAITRKGRKLVSARNGVPIAIIRRYMDEIGFEWVPRCK
jgi:hypothetical protein